MLNKTKIKRILPSLREKERYIAFEVISERELDKDMVNNAVFNASLDYIGQIGAGGANLSVLDYDKKSSKGIIKVNNKYVEHIKAGLILIRKINNVDVIIKTIGVSGILKKLKNKYIAY